MSEKKISIALPRVDAEGLVVLSSTKEVKGFLATEEDGTMCLFISSKSASGIISVLANAFAHIVNRTKV